MDIKHFAAKFVTCGLKKFSNRHKGETCYIFGDGPSVKWFDLSMFKDNLSICSGVLPFHNDFNKLKAKYFTVAEPWLFMPKVFQPTYLHEYKCVGEKYLKFIKSSSDKEFFINLSNMPVLSGKNVNYIFRRLPVRGNRTDSLLGKFNLFNGSFRAPLAIAYYLGFSKVYLVGFDAWTIQPARNLHWYEKGRGEFFNATNFDMDFLNILKEVMDIYTISIDGGSKNVKNISYEAYTGKPPVFRENYELLSPHYLKVLASYTRYKIF